MPHTQNQTNSVVSRTGTISLVTIAHKLMSVVRQTPKTPVVADRVGVAGGTAFKRLEVERLVPLPIST
jgi:hypothetical protein